MAVFVGLTSEETASDEKQESGKWFLRVLCEDGRKISGEKKDWEGALSSATHSSH